MTCILRCSDVEKKYHKIKALDKVNVKIETGRIVGLLGPNGAGKTTLMKCIVGLLHYDRGEIFIDNVEPSYKSKEIVAYLPDTNFLYHWMTIEEAVHYYEKAFRDFDTEKAYETLKFLKLDKSQKISDCSKGMQEKLNIALTLSRKAKLYIFDEPLATVDPYTREIILKMIKTYFNSSQSSLLISTHLIKDVESLFDDVAIISDGRILLYDTVQNIDKKYHKPLEEVFKERICYDLESV